MSSKKFFTIFMIIFMLFSVSGCGGSGGHTQNITNNPVSPDNPAPIHEPKSDDITIIPEPSPLSQDKPVSQEPIPIPPVPTPTLYTVTFNSNGGSAVSSITVSSGNTVTKPNDPSKYGYTFDGWYMDSALTHVFRFGSNGDKVTGNITLYAKWIETDMLRAEIAIGKISIGYQDGDNANSVTKNLTLPTFVNVSGDVNVSWSSNALSVISNSGIVTRPSGRDIVVELTAKATAGFASRTKTFTVTVIHEANPAPSGYTVTFNSNGGSAVASIHTSSGGTIIMPENPVREGYVFAGWYKDEAFTEIFTFGADGDKITKDITLYAQWINTDTLRAEHALGEIVIGYANGDNPKYITKNLTLPTKVDDVNISWSSSNSGTVSSNGTVIRPSGHDTDVTLTATALSGSKSASRTFNVKVIRARSRVSSDIPVVDIKDIVSGDFSIRYETSSDQIADIEGNYSRITIQNADDALDAIQGIHVALGINNPYEELQTSVVTSDSSGAEYQFQQVYNGVRVYGYGIMASANSEGKGDFLHANIMSSDLLAKLDRSTLRLRTSSDADSTVVSHYSGSVEAVSADTELIIFALREYENNPVYAYIVSVSGTDWNGEYIDETVIINAATGAIIWKSPNMNEAHHSIATTKKVTSKNELSKDVSFPIKLSNGYWNMIDDTEEPTIEIHSGDVSSWFHNTIVKRKISETMTGWDIQAVSAYTNMREILRWWRDTFSRNSLDDKGMTVKIVVHQYAKEKLGKDNACWNGSDEKIFISDKQDRLFSSAAAVDVLTHESTHAVIRYITGIKDWGEESPLRSITEGYADVFACIKDKNWTIGEDLFSANGPKDCFRNIETRYVSSMSSSEAYIDSVHYVSYAAYLMHQNGLTWDELGKIWYKSMSMGYQSKILWWTVEEKVLNKSSTFDDVLRCLIWASEKLVAAGELPREKLSCVYNALDEVFYNPASLSGTVTDYETGKAISGISIEAKFSSASYEASKFAKTDGKGAFSLNLFNESGKCKVTAVDLDKRGYTQTVIHGVEIDVLRDNTLNLQLVRLNAESSLSGTIRNSSGAPLENVKVGRKMGWNSPSNEAFVDEETSTDENGQYSFEVLTSGYYTVELKKSGYKTATFNVIVSGNTTEQNWTMEEGSDEYDIPIDEAHFPDDYFRTYISNNIDSDKDGILSKTEIENTTDIDVCNSSNKSLQGIEYFTSLQRLYCWNNWNQKLTALDLSKNTALQELYCNNNKLTTLDISGCIALKTLYCYDNNLMTLDLRSCSSLLTLGCKNNNLTTLDVSKNTSLQYLNCDHNNLTALDVSSCTALGALYCRENSLTTLDLSGCSSLLTLECAYNQLTTLNVSGCIALQTLSCYSNQLTALDLSNNTALQILMCGDNQLTALDISENTALEHLECAYNQLTALDLSNNTALQALYCSYNQLTTLNLSSCPNLNSSNVTCNSGVTIIWPPSSSSSSAAALKSDSASTILAVLPSFTPDESGTYSFTVSLDRTPPEDSSLLLLSDSEDLNASFALTDEADTVRLSADFTAGRTYAPVIVATSEGESQSGGCNAGIAGIILLAGIIIVLSKIGHVREMRGRE